NSKGSYCFNPCCSVDMTGRLVVVFPFLQHLMFQSLLFCGYDWKILVHREELRTQAFQSLLFCGYDWKLLSVTPSPQSTSCFNPCCSVDMTGRIRDDADNNFSWRFNPCCSVDMTGSFQIYVLTSIPINVSILVVLW